MRGHRCAFCGQKIRRSSRGWIHVSLLAKVNGHEAVPEAGT